MITMPTLLHLPVELAEEIRIEAIKRGMDHDELLSIMLVEAWNGRSEAAPGEVSNAEIPFGGNGTKLSGPIFNIEPFTNDRPISGTDSDKATGVAGTQ